MEPLDNELRKLGDPEGESALDALNPPSKTDYLNASNRVVLRVMKVLGADLTKIETDLLRGYSEEVDSEVLRRYRATLPERDSRRQHAMLLRLAYKEAKQRGAVWEGKWLDKFI